MVWSGALGTVLSGRQRGSGPCAYAECGIWMNIEDDDYLHVHAYGFLVIFLLIDSVQACSPSGSQLRTFP